MVSVRSVERYVPDIHHALLASREVESDYLYDLKLGV